MEILTFTVTPFFVNCYVVKSGGEAIVIDPGDVSRELVHALTGVSVRMIVNTHCHCDHCGGNAALVRDTHAPLAIHEEDLPLLQAMEAQAQMFGISVTPSPMPDQYLKEGDTVSVGSIHMSVIHAPGHSPGHIMLAGEGFVFVGDVIFAGSIGRTDLPGGNYEQLIQSIHSKLMGLPDHTVLYTGHGPATTVGEERRHNPFLTGL